MDNLTTNNTFREVLVLCTCILNYQVVSHAGTFLRQEDKKGKVLIKYYDPNENHFFERGGHRIDYRKLFSRFELITIYALKGRPVRDEEERERINSKMARIMTGKVQAQFLKATFVKNANTVNKKRSRKSKGWRHIKARK